MNVFCKEINHPLGFPIDLLFYCSPGCAPEDAVRVPEPAVLLDRDSSGVVRMLGYSHPCSTCEICHALVAHSRWCPTWVTGDHNDCGGDDRDQV